MSASKTFLRKTVFLICLLIHFYAPAQTTIKMEKFGGVYKIPCKVNGLALKFIFDTGASDVSISLSEAIFMLKNEYLMQSDIGESIYYKIANGNIEEGTKINLRTIEIQGLLLHNVEASISQNITAPLLLGQTALSKLGKIQIDFNAGQIIVLNNSIPSTTEPKTINSDNYSGAYLFRTNFTKHEYMKTINMREEPSPNGFVVYECPQKSIVWVIEKTNDLYWKASVDGHLGYIPKGFLERQF